MAQSFLKFLRGPSTGAAAAPGRASSAERIARHSTGFNEFSRQIAGQEGLVVLDLGPTSPRNIQYLTELGHKIYNEDVLMAAADPRDRKSTRLNSSHGYISYAVFCL